MIGQSGHETIAIIATRCLSFRYLNLLAVRHDKDRKSALIGLKSGDIRKPGRALHLRISDAAYSKTVLTEELFDSGRLGVSRFGHKAGASGRRAATQIRPARHLR